MNDCSMDEDQTMKERGPNDLDHMLRMKERGPDDLHYFSLFSGGFDSLFLLSLFCRRRTMYIYSLYETFHTSLQESVVKNQALALSLGEFIQMNPEWKHSVIVNTLDRAWETADHF